jgi:hypothetical protein
MAEYFPPQEEQFGSAHRPNTEAALLELSRLLAIFLASKSFAALRKAHPEYPDVLDPLADAQDDEITRILLTLAIIARVIDDREEGALDFIANEWSGELEEKVPTKAHILIKHLGIRDACNKIIHANKVHFDLDTDEHGQKYLNPFIYLYGERQDGGEWRATLDVLRFATQYARTVKHF